MKGRKRVYIDWTYYEQGNGAPIAAHFSKGDSDYISYIRESDAIKEIKDWRIAADTWKKSYNDLIKNVKKRLK